MKRFLPLLCFLWGITLEAQHRKPEIGIAQSLEYDSLLAASGYKYLVESVGKLFSPVTVTDEQFEKNLARIRQSKVKLYALNIFMPGELKLVGPDVDEAKILLYCERVFQRCKIADVRLIVWGSGGARRIPDGFDRAKAQEQFVSIASKIARLAKKYKIRLALENLNRTETNFINTAAGPVASRAVGVPAAISFRWHQLTDDGVGSQLMALDYAGNLVVTLVTGERKPPG